MTRAKRAAAAAAVVAIAATTLTACDKKADVVSRNISTAADSFEVNRRIVFYNGITGETMLEIDGLCSLGNDDPSKYLSVTCETTPGQYKKHFLGLSDNVTYFVEQLDPVSASDSHYRVVWKPSTLIPNLDIQ